MTTQQLEKLIYGHWNSERQQFVQLRAGPRVWSQLLDSVRPYEVVFRRKAVCIAVLGVPMFEDYTLPIDEIWAVAPNGEPFQFAVEAKQ